MNILNYELKRFFKPFLFWLIGLFIMLVLGMYKFEAIASSGTAIGDLMDSFPKIVLAIFGMSSLNIGTLAGYYGVLFIYIVIMGAVFAINLGSNSTALEINDKTADFIFSKPVSRSHVLLMKHLSGIIYLILFCIFSYIFSMIGIASVKETNNINNILLLLNGSLFLVMMIYYMVASLASIINPKLGYLIIIIALMGDYVVYIFHEMLSYSWLRFLTPLKYFDIAYIIKHQKFELTFILLTLFVIVISAYYTYRLNNTKNID